jgi:predicted porin
MKKSLFALAAATAFTGAAQAQSSVTVYGILDVGYTGGNARTSAGSTTTNQNVSRISNSMESGSRIGFRGNEDVGGGTSVQFTYELNIQPAGNQGSNADGVSSNTAGAGTWNPTVRQAFVGITQKGMGNLRIGTQNTLFWEQAGANTTGQLSQTLGSMLAPTTDGTYFSTAALNGTFTTTSANGAAFGSYTSRTNNTVRIATERMAGVMLKGAYTMSNSNTNQSLISTGGYTGGTNNQTGYQAALDWNIEKANIQASYASFKSENPWGTVSAAATCTVQTTTCTPTGVLSTAGATPVAWGGGTQGTNVTDAQALVTASYDFGILRAYAGWTNRKLTNGNNSNQFAKRTAQEIGVRGYVTKTVEGWASIGNGRYTGYGTSQPTANISGYQAGANYWMSKRTNLYAIYGQNATSSTSAGAAAASQYSLGIRHTF